jgi:hypothetical protein
MPTKLDRTVKPGWVANVLSIDVADLPKLDRPWSKRDIRALRVESPKWLADVRRRHATRVQQDREALNARLDAEITRLGYNDPDLGTVDQAVLYIAGAITYLMHETGCTERDGDMVALRRLPKSMEAEEHVADTEERWY